MSARAPQEAEIESPLPGWTVASEPTASIGGNDPREEYTLFDVRAATVLQDGRIIIANGGSSELVFYSNRGEYLSTAGGNGQGPGEFRVIYAMARLPGDSLLVLSFSPGLTWLDPQGRYLRSRMVLPRVGMDPCRIGERFLLPDGRFLQPQEDNPGMPGCLPRLAGLYRVTTPVTVYDPRTDDSDSLGVFPSTERFGPLYLPHGALLLTAWSTRHVFVGDTGADSILVFDLNGVRVGALATPYPLVPIPKLRMERKIDDVGWPGRNYTPKMVEMPYPDAYPRYGRLLADTEGMLWVMAYPQTTTAVRGVMLTDLFGTSYREPSPEWTVLDPTRGAVARVAMPRPLYPLEIGEDYILGLVRDELDVETILLYALERGSGG